MNNPTHAFLVEGSGNEHILKQMMSLFSTQEFHFIVHWDRKSANQPDFSKFSNVTIIPSMSVFWGTDTQVLTEKKLFQTALNMFPDVKWVHLISESDVPLMSPSYFLNYFNYKMNSDVEFDGEANAYRDRIKYWMPIRKLNFKNSYMGLLLHRSVKAFNMILKVNRLKKIKFPIYKGSNWVSLTNADLKKVVGFKNFEMFLHSSLADEVYVQTILGNDHLLKRESEKLVDNRYLLLGHRYIDWIRGEPYQFQDNDIAELMNLINGTYSFARKVKSNDVAKKLIEKLAELEYSNNCIKG